MLTQARALELLHYDPETGAFTWRVNRGNNRVAGKPAGSIRSDGYLAIEIDQVAYKRHRLAVFMVTGAWPEHEIDHDDRVRSNNRWKNLIPATHKQNSENLGMNPLNKSGVRGVYWNKEIGKWHAQIGHNCRRVHIGFFDDLTVASQAREAAVKQLFTHVGSAR